ncbi:MAG: hypothetical protein VCD00_18280 [Candidatus Hydrogenedentota bacterium]
MQLLKPNLQNTSRITMKRTENSTESAEFGLGLNFPAMNGTIGAHEAA